MSKSKAYNKVKTLSSAEASIVFLLLITGIAIISLPVAAIVAPIFSLNYWFVTGLVAVILTLILVIEGIFSSIKKETND